MLTRHTHHTHSIEEADGSQVLFDEEGGLVHDNVQPGHMLWVDKYSPHHYTELLSDDVRGRPCNNVCIEELFCS